MFSHSQIVPICCVFMVIEMVDFCYQLLSTNEEDFSVAINKPKTNEVQINQTDVIWEKNSYFYHMSGAN